VGGVVVFISFWGGGTLFLICRDWKHRRVGGVGGGGVPIKCLSGFFFCCGVLGVGWGPGCVWVGCFFWFFFGWFAKKT